MRSCVACRISRPQAELVRLAVSDGRLLLDTGPGRSRRPGRGAYLCGEEACLQRALARDALLLRRALRAPATVTVPEELRRVPMAAPRGA